MPISLLNQTSVYDIYSNLDSSVLRGLHFIGLVISSTIPWYLFTKTPQQIIMNRIRPKLEKLNTRRSANLEASLSLTPMHFFSMCFPSHTVLNRLAPKSSAGLANVMLAEIVIIRGLKQMLRFKLQPPKLVAIFMTKIMDTSQLKAAKTLVIRDLSRATVAEEYVIDNDTEANFEFLWLLKEVQARRPDSRLLALGLYSYSASLLAKVHLFVYAIAARRHSRLLGSKGTHKTLVTGQILFNATWLWRMQRGKAEFRLSITSYSRNGPETCIHQAWKTFRVFVAVRETTALKGPLPRELLSIRKLRAEVDVSMVQREKGDGDHRVPGNKGRAWHKKPYSTFSGAKTESLGYWPLVNSFLPLRFAANTFSRSQFRREILFRRVLTNNDERFGSAKLERGEGSHRDGRWMSTVVKFPAPDDSSPCETAQTTASAPHIRPTHAVTLAIDLQHRSNASACMSLEPRIRLAPEEELEELPP
ncbi:uncharacterized protein BDR25DRAFT_348090 [Lindgomyces ingoldianus]|uniref:Uncharacterized protein n=1 Tax=Lindgomyces ingoldianus TaxID=673940 RepID=A0ACB6RH14_9PLEO|nr:uncharacterized protein BDR25DRAFT_348090 [Lindgomyces ingoldianus]KAF2477771.1 hypothetical protein BDR25DRAFT_348090 [Lindgomyces ingoldianus]